jgi:hypothetical protein
MYRTPRLPRVSSAAAQSPAGIRSSWIARQQPEGRGHQRDGRLGNRNATAFRDAAGIDSTLDFDMTWVAAEARQSTLAAVGAAPRTHLDVMNASIRLTPSTRSPSFQVRNASGYEVDLVLPTSLVGASVIAPDTRRFALQIVADGKALASSIGGARGRAYESVAGRSVASYIPAILPLLDAQLARSASGRKGSSIHKPSWFKSSASCALGYVISFLVLASVLRSSFGFPLDDSWIHEVIARNLADYEVLGFLPGQLSSGSSSLLWTLLLTARPLLFPGLAVVIYCAGLSFLLLALIGFVLKRMTEKDGVPASISWCLALAPAASGNFIWFGMIGMEHLLFILLSLCIIAAWFNERSTAERPHFIVLPLLCFLLVITRPEGVCLLLLLFLCRRSAGRSVKEWILATIGAACGGAVSAAVNWMTGHHLTPLTMQGRNGVLPSTDWIGLRGEFIGHTLARLISVWNINLPHEVLHDRPLLLGLPLALILVALISLAIRELRALHANRFLLLCVWGGFIEALYFLMLPSPGHGGRYIAVPVMLFLPLVFFGLREALKLTPLSTKVAWMTVAVCGAVTAVLSLTAWRAVAVAGIEQINTEHGTMAIWIQDNLPASAIANRQIAVFDIGRIGYQLHGNLIDMGGLVDYRFRTYLVHARTTDYLREHGVKYVVLAGNTDLEDLGFSSGLSLDKAHGSQLSLVHHVCADAAVARLAFTASETALPCQRLYAIRYVTPETP